MSLNQKLSLFRLFVSNPGKYKFALQQAQKHAALLLEAQLRLAEVLRGIKIRRGIRTDLKTKANKIVKSKKEIIANDYNLTIRQARDIEKLTKECRSPKGDERSEWSLSVIILLHHQLQLAGNKNLAIYKI